MFPIVNRRDLAAKPRLFGPVAGPSRLYTAKMSRLTTCALVGLLLLGTGCTAAPPPADPSPMSSERMVLTWSRDLSAEPQAIAAFEAEASRVAGVAVRRVAAVSGQVVVITLECGGRAQCETAAQRLRADRRVVELVADQRKRPHNSSEPSPRSN